MAKKRATRRSFSEAGPEELDQFLRDEWVDGDGAPVDSHRYLQFHDPWSYERWQRWSLHEHYKEYKRAPAPPPDDAREREFVLSGGRDDPWDDDQQRMMDQLDEGAWRDPPWYDQDAQR